MGKRIEGFQDPNLEADAETLERAEAEWLQFAMIHPFEERRKAVGRFGMERAMQVIQDRDPGDETSQSATM